MLEFVLMVLGALIGPALIALAVVRRLKATGNGTAPATTPATAGTPSPAKKSWWNRLDPQTKLRKVPWKWIVIAFVAGEGVFGFFSMTNVHRPPGLGRIPHWETPSLATAGSWMWAHWLPVLVLYGSLMALLALSSKGTSWAKEAENLQGVLTVAVAAAFVVLPPLGWFVDYPSNSPRMTETLYPTKQWTHLTLGPREASPRIWVKPGGYTVPINGPVATRITCLYADRAPYTFRADQTPCPAGNMSYVVVTNPYTMPITVKYKSLQLAGP